MQSNRASVRLAFTVLLFWLLVTMAWWAFAFMQIPESAPDWVSQVRGVCFGTQPSGLPDTWGFFKLLAPLPMLIALLVLWWAEFKQLPALIKQSMPLIVLVGAVLLGSFIEAAWVATRVQASIGMQFDPQDNRLQEDFPSTYPRTNKQAVNFELINQHGNTVRLEDYGQQPVILTFAFAHCQTICPMLVQTAKKMMTNIKGAKPQLMIITLDPWRDTPSSLPGIAKAWGLPAEAFLLSGTVDYVNQVLDDYQIARKKNANDGDIVHPGIFYVINAGRIVYTLNSPSSATLAAATLRSQTVPSS